MRARAPELSGSQRTQPGLLKDEQGATTAAAKPKTFLKYGIKRHAIAVGHFFTYFSVVEQN